MMPEVLSQIHDRHPSATELALDRVALGESGLKGSEQFGHAGAPEGALSS